MQCVGILQKLLRICTLDEMNFLWSVSSPNELEFSELTYLNTYVYYYTVIELRIRERKLAYQL